MELAKKTIKEDFKEKVNKISIESAKKISIKEGCAYSVSDGLGVRYITPYALSLGANNVHIGLLSSLPSLIGNFSQLHSIKAMENVSRKNIAFFGALLQAIMWLFVIAVGFIFFNIAQNKTIAPSLLILIYIILIVGGASYGPAWNSWMKDLVTKESGKYFGRRNKICGAVALVSMLIGGFILDYFKNTKVFIGFFILFFIAFIARSISASLFRKQYEPRITYEKGYYFSFWQFIKAMTKNNFGRFVIFIALMQLANNIAAPFFAVYMLKSLHFNYVTFIIVILSAPLAKLIFMPIWGGFADKYGNLKVMKICGFLIPFVPILWLLSPLVLKYGLMVVIIYLFVIEFFSGFSWAGFDLSSSNFIYDAVTRQRMALCVAYSNILNGIAIFIGATLGGLLASRVIFFGLTPLLFVFLVSGITRMLVQLIMNRKVREVREVEKFGIKEAREQMMTLKRFRFPIS